MQTPFNVAARAFIAVWQRPCVSLFQHVVMVMKFELACAEIA